ncbi:hypothetical protein JCM33774_47640 [Actinophytocola sp. KF-1]
MGAPVPPKPSRGGVTTLVAGLLALVVAGLAVGGSFGVIWSYRNERDAGGGEGVTFSQEASWWGHTTRTTSVTEQDLFGGVTLVLAAALLVIGAVFAFVASRSRRAGAVSGTRSLISAGVGVLAGVILFQLANVLTSMSVYNDQELDAGESLEYSADLGLWLPLGGLVLGLVAVVLAHVGQRARVEPNTPRMGFPAPYGYRPQHMPVAERPTDVQPEGDDATTTQRVSGATASGTFAPVTPPGQAPVAAPAPLTPATTSVPATGPQPVEQEKPTVAEPPAAQPASEPAAAKPAGAESPAEPAPPAAEAEPPAATPPAAPAPTTPPAPAAEPAATPPATPSATPAPPAPPGSAAPGERSALPDFPAAPPAPDDDKTGK